MSEQKSYSLLNSRYSFRTSSSLLPLRYEEEEGIKSPSSSFADARVKSEEAGEEERDLAPPPPLLAPAVNRFAEKAQWNREDGGKFRVRTGGGREIERVWK